MASPEVEARRVLPSLLVSETPQDAPDTVPVQDEAPPRRGRGRPRKLPLPVSQAIPQHLPAIVAAPEVKPSVLENEPAPPAASANETPRRSTLGLGRGEKWKRRLRWR